ncbi:hypothetical protein HMI54_006729 [Coelomomyces lativittatus]|nr:hypothetical protein HMI55_004843 [Coelomomyces lativittatus]KAJ1504671.1 hypothetical protein HMI54_006729 [Coelomomyces lativittatus]KAJ1504941.1 hypothetical protein HMI56_001381 [Coelomomyces lativittatus]
MIDTCQANTMYSAIRSPGILSMGSSKKDQSSYSHHMDQTLGVSVIDRFTHVTLRMLERIDRTSRKTVGELFESYSVEELLSEPGISSTGPSTTETLLTDFLASVSPILHENHHKHPHSSSLRTLVHVPLHEPAPPHLSTWVPVRLDSAVILSPRPWYTVVMHGGWILAWVLVAYQVALFKAPSPSSSTVTAPPITTSSPAT